MANDILNAVTSTTVINNGTVVVGTGARGTYGAQILDDGRAVHTPLITTIQDKYDDKFDDPRYYTGDAAT